MPNYIRAKYEGGYYFFTLVTFQRKKLFYDELARDCLKVAIEKTRIRRPFEIIAFCLLPDHIHCIWKLPEGDWDYSKRLSSIKGQFSIKYSKFSRQNIKVSSSRARKGEVCIWQRRFWEHQIRDEKDLQRHFNYIHYNPVKNGLVQNIEDWLWSSYHKFVKEGFYGRSNNFEAVANINMDDFGE
jgi:putative transposase